MATTRLVGVRFLLVPYDSGRHAERLGGGPDALMPGVLERLQGVRTEVRRIEVDAPFLTEASTAFALAQRLAVQVKQALTESWFPFVLAGNCFSALGTMSGLGQEVGVLWFDCHGDFNTPETTPTGFLDGMAIAALNGRCWTRLAATIPGYRPVPGQRIVHLAGRDFDPGEKEALEAAGVLTVSAADLRTRGATALAQWPTPSAGIYLHLDLDSLDPSAGRVNSYQKPGGLTVAELKELLTQLSQRGPVRGAAVTAYDASGDPDGRAREAGIELITHLTRLVL